MKTAAIICEYNPFHNGHKYQIEQIKKTHDAVVCIMSGSFVQRGAPAVFDKWTRTRAALLSGGNLVIELPVCSALNCAERFALGGVFLSDALGICDTLFFGSESGDINNLCEYAKILSEETDDVSEKIKSNMMLGMSFPLAKEKAYSDIIPPEFLNSPNNILGIEYIKALNKLKSKIVPKTIKRACVSHHSLLPSGEFASASFIREQLTKGNNISDYVPFSYPDKMKNDGLGELIRYKILEMTPDEISKINDVTEGLENRIIEACRLYSSFDEICTHIKSKRYTLSRIRRILLSCLIGIDKESANKLPSYIRVLGADDTGLSLLSEIKKKTSLPMITKTADFKSINKSFALDIKSTDIFSIINKQGMGKDFLTSPQIIKKV